MPEIRTGEEEEAPYNYEETKEDCEYWHYEICTDMLNQCEELGYGKQELEYSDKIELVTAAVEVEMSQLLSEEMLPAVDGAVRTMESASKVVESYAKEDQNDPIVKAKINRDFKNLDKTAKKAGARSMQAQRKMLKSAQEIGRLHKMAAHYDKTGEKTDEKTLDKKIKSMYSHAQDFTKKYDEKHFGNSAKRQKNNSADLSPVMQKKMLDDFKTR